MSIWPLVPVGLPTHRGMIFKCFSIFEESQHIHIWHLFESTLEPYTILKLIFCWCNVCFFLSCFVQILELTQENCTSCLPLLFVQQLAEPPYYVHAHAYRSQTELGLCPAMNLNAPESCILMLPHKIINPLSKLSETYSTGIHSANLSRQHSLTERRWNGCEIGNFSNSTYMFSSHVRIKLMVKKKLHFKIL